MDLFVLLRNPGQIALVPAIPDPLYIGNLKCVGGFAPTGLQADILIEPCRREFLGLSYPIPKKQFATIQLVANLLDKNLVTYNDLSSNEGKHLYSLENAANTHFLEIVWSRGPNMQYLPALLASDVWYYSGKESLDGYALSIGDLDGLLNKFTLSMPTSFSIPIGPIA